MLKWNETRFSRVFGVGLPAPSPLTGVLGARFSGTFTVLLPKSFPISPQRFAPVLPESLGNFPEMTDSAVTSNRGVYFRTDFGWALGGQIGAVRTSLKRYHHGPCEGGKICQATGVKFEK